jgi:hypothetical protein
VAVAIIGWGLSASAQTPDKALCAVQQAVSCGAYDACERSLPAAVNLPALMRIDVEAAVVESRQENGTIRSSKIATTSIEGDARVLYGVDGGHPWTMRINLENGAFTLTVLREEQGFIGFGVCSAKILP